MSLPTHATSACVLPLGMRDYIKGVGNGLDCTLHSPWTPRDTRQQMGELKQWEQRLVKSKQIF